MPQRPSRSLKHEYELFVEREIENYKESVPRSVLLSIGDEAVRALADEQQFALTELLLWDEVDRIIFKRLRLPSYATWRKQRLKLLDELKRPEHWGLSPDDASFVRSNRWPPRQGARRRHAGREPRPPLSGGARMRGDGAGGRIRGSAGAGRG